jgi:outer membrane protein assembly factor BamB
MKIRTVVIAIVLGSFPVLHTAQTSRSTGLQAAPEYRTWPVYGGGPDQIRYSRLDQINRSNVHQLEVAWTFDPEETGGLQTNPIVVDGVVYTTTPKHRVVALDGATGALRWKFDSDMTLTGPNRGVTYWAEGDDRRIFVGQDSFVYALHAQTGRPIPTFGRDGRIDLREDLGRPPEAQSIRLTTPGVIYQDLLIVGGRVSEGLPAAPGHVRAYDTRTGKLRWRFHTIPHPGEYGYDTWPKDAWTYSGGANNWAGMAVDPETFAVLEVAYDRESAERAWRENVPEGLDRRDDEHPSAPGVYGLIDDVDFDRQVVVVWSSGESGSCPEYVASIDTSGRDIRVRTDGGFGVCTSDYNPYRMVVAVDRDRLPAQEELETARLTDVPDGEVRTYSSGD